MVVGMHVMSRIANGDVKTANCCDHILSGDSKRECQDLIAIGDWIQ